MAVSLEKIEAWLPTELPTEEDLLQTNTTNEFDPSCFPTEFPYEFDSTTSPTDTDSSRDDDREELDSFLAGLTRRLTEQVAFTPEKKKREVVGSPESTLGGIGSCCWSVSVSSNGSPNGGPSPPTTPFALQDDTLDRICAAAGHIARLKIGASNGLLGPAVVGPKSLQSPAGVCYAAQSFFPNTSPLYQEQHLGERQEQVGRPQQYTQILPKPQQQVKPNWHHQSQKQQQHTPYKLDATGTVFHQGSAGRSVRPLGLPQSAWPPLQPPQKLSNRPGYFGGSGGGGGPLPIGVKRERTGTGVFLPQPKLSHGNNSSLNPKFSDSSKRKAGCSSVVVPAKVIQALNMNLEDRIENGLGLDQDHMRFHTSVGVSNYDLLVARRNAILAAQKRNLLLSEGLLNHELHLPRY